MTLVQLRFTLSKIGSKITYSVSSLPYHGHNPHVQHRYDEYNNSCRSLLDLHHDLKNEAHQLDLVSAFRALILINESVHDDPEWFGQLGTLVDMRQQIESFRNMADEVLSFDYRVSSVKSRLKKLDLESANSLEAINERINSLQSPGIPLPPPPPLPIDEPADEPKPPKLKKCCCCYCPA